MAMTERTDKVDVDAVVAGIKARVAERRARGDYPDEVLTAASDPFDIAATADPPEMLELIQSSRPLRSTKPVIGPLVVLAKKVIRRLLSWYVHPIAQDQTRFNDAITRELRALQRRVEELEQR
jgi:hypothetical protein